jgi:dTDP-4-amino-4,6-dideoxygalactose transaminase
MNLTNAMKDLSSLSVQSIEHSFFDHQEVEAIAAVVESGAWWMGTKGNPIVSELEKTFSVYQNTRYALAVTNGSHALEIILRNLGVAPKTEVILPAYAPVSTGMVVLMLGATPVFVDVQQDSMTLDPMLLEDAITANTKAIVAVHLNGVANNIIDLANIAKRFNIPLVEDCSHAHGASFKGKRVGSFGVAGAFDFHSSQMISGGEGGMIVTNDRNLYQNCWSQHNCGRGWGKARNQYFNVGTNYRMTVFQAALIQAQLKRFMAKVRPAHLRNIAVLDHLFNRMSGVIPQFRHFELDAPAFRYSFRYDTEALGGTSRDLMITALGNLGIPAQRSHAIALPRLPLFQAHLQDSSMKYTIAEALEDTVICLPHSLLLESPEEIAKGVESLVSKQEISV